MRNHHLGQLAQLCLAGDDAVEDSRQVLRALIEAYRTTNAWLGLYTDVLSAIVAAHPLMALDELFAAQLDALDDFHVAHVLNSKRAAPGGEGSVLSAIRDEDLLTWVEKDPATRAPRLAKHADAFIRTANGELAWSPLALKLLDQTVGLNGVFDALEERFLSGTETGSFVDRFARIRRAAEPLQNHPSPRVRAWASQLLPRLNGWIDSFSRHERGEFARFE